MKKTGSDCTSTECDHGKPLKKVNHCMKQTCPNRGAICPLHQLLMPTRSRHPSAEIEQRFQILEKQGWTVILAKGGSYWEVTCKAGTMNCRIGRDKKKAMKELADFLIRHSEGHSRE